MSEGSIDAEVQNIQDQLVKAHRIFYDLAFGMTNLTAGLDKSLSAFTQEIESVGKDVVKVRSDVFQVTDSFPNRTSYMAILLVVDLIIWVLAGFLLYKIIQNCRFGPKNSQKMVAKYDELMSKTARDDIVPVYTTPKDYYAITVDSEDDEDYEEPKERRWNILMPREFWKKAGPIDDV
ncbi:unnamed protein product [Bursaphelenchus xylophilus]|uniref:(pine wood nematode) hypothetical protein n=1 Tax=Bursaphelenchus xylophilus TaxID=6326 RepID=A0A1I7RXY3_BURXY|nr:unnamed protein product [Bursaphelenchus xylophilus]CAG9125249.1 unnamed protein product [Bursaphelenchus xylophilus]